MEEDYFNLLPSEVTSSIYSYLDPGDYENLSRSSRSLRQLGIDESVQRESIKTVVSRKRDWITRTGPMGPGGCMNTLVYSNMRPVEYTDLVPDLFKFELRTSRVILNGECPFNSQGLLDGNMLLTYAYSERTRQEVLDFIVPISLGFAHGTVLTESVEKNLEFSWGILKPQPGRDLSLVLAEYISVEYNDKFIIEEVKNMAKTFVSDPFYKGRYLPDDLKAASLISPPMKLGEDIRTFTEPLRLISCQNYSNLEKGVARLVNNLSKFILAPLLREFMQLKFFEYSPVNYFDVKYTI